LLILTIRLQAKKCDFSLASPGRSAEQMTARFMGEQIALERVLRRIKARLQELAGFCEENERFSPQDRGFRRRPACCHSATL
jgi:hypothetical protein